MSAIKGVGFALAVATLASASSCASVEPLGSVELFDAALSPGGRSGVAPGNESAGGVTGPDMVGSSAGGFVPPVGNGGFPTPPPPGNFGNGGRLGTGGRAPTGSAGVSAAGAPPRATGGAPEAGGGTSVSVGGGTSGPPMCAATEKICGGVCALPSPKVGCGMTGCDPCTMTAPANGYLTCVNGMCGYDCLSGATKTDKGCDAPPPTPAGGSCPNSPVGCPDCGAVFGPGCCNGMKCGCSPIPWTVGILGCI